MELTGVRAIDFGETRFGNAVQIQDMPFIHFLFFYRTDMYV